MLLDAKLFSGGTTLDTDVCIVGAGPAGLVLAAELCDQCDVIILESGGDHDEPDAQALNDGDLIGDEYAGLSATRHRRLGGTSRIWNTPVAGAVGAKFVPLDAADFQRRGRTAHGDWPFGLTDLLDDYRLAQRICGLGAFAYDATQWAHADCEPWPDTEALVSRVYQLATRDALLAPLRASIERGTNVRLYTHATAVRLRGAGRRVAGVAVTATGGASWEVRAQRVVICAGAIENARLLLLTEAVDNASGWLGRGFMEHPRDTAIVLRPQGGDRYASSRFYDIHRATDGTWILGRLAPSDEALRDGAMPNASATLLARPSRWLERLRRALPERARRRVPGGGHGWSERSRFERLFDGFNVLLNIEQLPHPENRVTLGQRRDPLGVPVPVLEWRWRPDDQRGLDRLRALVAAELRAIGGVTIDSSRRPDPNAHHHAGTTRMHDDPSLGVVDSRGRVHGMDNLYVAGASVFPTAGFANPMLTIVAMSVRLARHLRGETARTA